MTKKLRFALAIAAAAAPVHAASDTATRFGAREAVEQISLSPDGKKFVALIADGKRGMRAMVSTIDDSQPTATLLASTGEKERLDYCQWASNDRLVCGLSVTSGKVRDMIGFSRLVTIKADGKDLKLLSAPTSSDALQVMQSGGNIIDWQGDAEGNALLMTRQFVPDTAPAR